MDEAEKYYARAVALADQLAGDPQLDDYYKQTMAEARRLLAELRSVKSFKHLDEKDQAAGSTPNPAAPPFRTPLRPPTLAIVASWAKLILFASVRQ